MRRADDKNLLFRRQGRLEYGPKQQYSQGEAAAMSRLIHSGRGSARIAVRRRTFLQVGTPGSLGLSLPQRMTAQQAMPAASLDDDRACIMIFKLGGPSRLI